MTHRVFRMLAALGAALLCIVLTAVTSLAEAVSGAMPIDPADPAAPAYAAFFDPPQTKGELPVEIAANAQALGVVIVAGFGVPFPPGYVSDPNHIALVDNLGGEIPIHVTVLARWPKPTPGAGSIRAALIQFRTLMGATTPRTYTIRWGAPRIENEPQAWPARTDWVPADGVGYPSGVVSEPPLMATLPPQWLGKCLLKGRVGQAYQNFAFDLYDRALNYYFQVAVNDVSPGMPAQRRIDFATTHEPWLYDRATAFFVAYLRTGKREQLTQAHRAAQYYAAKTGPDGGFDLLPADRRHDVKYAYQECLLLDYWLTGDDSLLPVAKAIYPVYGAWNYRYKPEGGFWTERNLAFSLLGATAHYELTGDAGALRLARDIFEAALEHQTTPPPGAPADTGCLPHLGKAHGERAADDLWVCSPWMNALVLDAMLRYYIVSADARVPAAAMALGRFTARLGTHRVTDLHKNKPDVTVPYYLINPDGGPPRTEVDPWSDRMHAPDAIFILAVADYFRRRQGLPDSDHSELIGRLRATMDWNFEPVVAKSNRDKDGLPTLALSPPRKFGWWFRATAGMDWFLDQK